MKEQDKILQALQEENNNLVDEINKLKMETSNVLRNTNEIIWAEIFNNCINNSQWLINKSFSPGRWAVGYQYLYVAYRILNEVRPQRILELGLGQSTRLISQYAASNSNVIHTIVEHDPEWISFFQQDFTLPANSKILQLNRDYRTYREDDKVLSFIGFKEALHNKKFSFISIDAPLGGNALVYARVDILDILPGCLESSFIMIIDDYNRKGEQRMFSLVKEILHSNNIIFCEGIYKGQKDCIVVCSPDLKFICSM